MTLEKGGKNICGVTIGVLSLESYFPKPPGHIKNPSGLDFTTSYEILEGITVPDLLRNPNELMLQKVIAGAKKLENSGVKAITGSCGFLALYQNEIVNNVNIPVFVSSLIQLPLIYAMTNSPVGVLTASKSSLTDQHLTAVGAKHVPIITQGMDNSSEFAAVILRNERHDMDLVKIADEVIEAGKKIQKQDPSVKAIVLECTDMPPYAHYIQSELNLPIFDLTTLASMVASCVTRTKYSGFL